MPSADRPFDDVPPRPDRSRPGSEGPIPRAGWRADRAADQDEPGEPDEREELDGDDGGGGAPLAGEDDEGAEPRRDRRDARPRAVGWRSRDVIRAAALVVALWAGLQLLWRAYPLLLATFLGILFGLAVTSAVDRLERLRVPRFAGAALVVFGTLAAIGGAIALSAPLVARQSQQLRTQLPQAIDKIDAWIARQQDGWLGALLAQGSDAPGEGAGGSRGAAPADAAGGRRTTESERGAAEQRPSAERRSPSGGPSAQPAAEGSGAQRLTVREILSSGLGNARRMLFPFITSAAAALAGLLYVIFLAVYIAAERDLYHNGMMHLVPQRSRRRAADVLTAIAAQLRRWLTTQLVAMVVIGVVTTGVLLALRVPGAVPLGILAGLLEFIPTFGPVISAIPAILMGFADSPEKALSVAIAYMVIQFLEENVLIPILMKRGVDLPPALTIMAQALMALVFGFLGLLVAVPLLAAIVVGVKLLYVEGVVKDPMPDARRLVKADATG